MNQQLQLGKICHKKSKRRSRGISWRTTHTQTNMITYLVVGSAALDWWLRAAWIGSWSLCPTDRYSAGGGPARSPIGWFHAPPRWCCPPQPLTEPSTHPPLKWEKKLCVKGNAGKRREKDRGKENISAHRKPGATRNTQHNAIFTHLQVTSPELPCCLWSCKQPRCDWHGHRESLPQSHLFICK